MCVCMRACVLCRFSHVWLFETLWTGTCQAPLSTGFSRYEYWSGVPCPPLWDLPNSGIKPPSPSLAGGFFATSTTWEAHSNLYQCTVSLNHRYLIWHIKLIIAPHMYTFTKKENPIENTLKWGKKRSATLPEIQNQAWKPGCRGEGYWWHLLCEV